MGDLTHFALIILGLSLALLVAIGSNAVAERIHIPAPAVFLVAAALASDLVPRLGDLSVVSNQRVVTVALVLILFDGGMHIGWARFRPAAGSIALVGVLGTLLTAAGGAAVLHAAFGVPWYLALLVATAVSPTDPAVVFSVLGQRE